MGKKKKQEEDTSLYTIPRIDENLYYQIFLNCYGKIPTNISKTKTEHVQDIMNILDDMPQICKIAMVIGSRYNTWRAASNMCGIPKKKLIQQYNLAIKYMYRPLNIAKAVPKFYDVKRYSYTDKQLTKLDFNNKQYIITALNRSGIYTKEQLLKHLSLGYFFLWTIPGIGDTARQIILKTLDRWNGKSIINYHKD